ncbi:MAG TPA: NAD-dependent epimerase/dehydratase family protein [Solirubrobacteraceae bacterium]|nr:NAD-dependent epimerase/dehydratase family protein [Solirubrobacteraceae bacterium]
MRALVTGAGGFVGANLVRRLRDDGHDVHATARPGGDRKRLLGLTGATIHDVELDLPGAPGTLVADIAPEWIFHLAAHGAYSWQQDARQICQANLLSTIELADAAERVGVEAFIHAGSSSEYGFKDHAPDEHERPEPNSTYAVAKTAATMYCSHRAREGKLPAATLRLYSVYGAMEDPRRLVSALLQHGLHGELPPLVAPETARDFVYVEDVCEALMLAAEKADEIAGEVYNVGSGRQTTLRELVDCVRALLPIHAEPDWGSHAQRSWDTNIWCASTERAAHDLEWSATTSIEEGLTNTIAWMTARAAYDLRPARSPSHSHHG